MVGCYCVRGRKFPHYHPTSTQGLYPVASVIYQFMPDWFGITVDADTVSTGVMEMGGASLQIAFQPEGSILADKFPVKVGGRNYPVYVHSFLYYGQNYADLWVKQYLYSEMQATENPCMLKGG
jgi:hypothetical protein